MTPRGRGAPSQAFVLHRYDWSETSLILDLFTRDQGRVTVAAKGAKRPYSQLKSVLLPFQRILVTVGRPKTDETADVLTLRGAEWAGGAPMLSGAALFSGFYLNELMMKLLARGDAHPVLFDVYTATLPALAAEHDTLTQAALRAFEIVLLRETGLLPQLNVLTATQQPLQAERRYVLRPDTGVALHGQGEGALSGALLLQLQQALDAGDLRVLQTACAQGLAGLKASLRQTLHYHLGSARLRTRDVMIASQQLMERPPGLATQPAPPAASDPAP